MLITDKIDFLKKQTEKCMLCGSCKAYCPIYFSIHSESFSPRGRIKLLNALLEGRLLPNKEFYKRIYSCIMCGACIKQCSTGIDIPLTTIIGRELLNEKLKKGILFKNIVKIAFTKPAIFKSLYFITQPIVKSFLVKKGIIPESFSLPYHKLIDTQSIIKNGNIFFLPKDKKTKAKIVLFVGCSIQYLQPHIGEIFINLCNKLGYEVVIQKGEVCCGAPLLGVGMIKETEILADKNIKIFSSIKADVMVSLCPTCVITLKDTYKKLFGVGINIIDSVTFLKNVIDVKTSLNISALYHDPCHALYGLEQKSSPRELLEKIGVSIKEVRHNCCGGAGTFSIRFPKFSNYFLEERARAFQESKAELLITSCPECIFQLTKIISKNKILHIVEIFNKVL